jgi:hypothetical protein
MDSVAGELVAAASRTSWSELIETRRAAAALRPRAARVIVPGSPNAWPTAGRTDLEPRS